MITYGRNYVGQFEKGLEKGKGTFNYHDGIKHIGEWNNDQRKNITIYNPTGIVSDFIGNGNPYEEDMDVFLSKLSEIDSEPESVEEKNTLYRKIVNNKEVWESEGVISRHHRYIGDIKENLPNGFGVIYYLTGSQYKGNLLNGKRHGQGTYSDNQGFKDEGIWKNDIRWNVIMYDSGKNIIGRIVEGKSVK